MPVDIPVETSPQTRHLIVAAKPAIKVVLFGASLDTGNLGCSALTASVVRLFRGPGNTQVKLLYGHRNGGTRSVLVGDRRVVQIEVINSRMSPRAPWFQQVPVILLLAVVHRLIPLRSPRRWIVSQVPWLRAIWEADVAAEIRGGDSFSDIYGLRRFIEGLVPVGIAHLLRKPYVLLPQTYGPYKSWLAQRIATLVMRRATAIYSRDAEGVRLVSQMLGQGNEASKARFNPPPVRLCPDVAFALEPIEPPSWTTEPAWTGTNPGLRIGVNVSGLLYRGGYTRNNMFGLQFDYAAWIRQLIVALAARPNTEVFLVPHVLGDSLEGDTAAIGELWTALPEEVRGRCRRVTSTHNQHEIKWIIGRCDFFIGARMHACIAALSQGIPCVGVAYSRKFAGVFESIGVGDLVVDARSLSGDEATAKTLTVLDQLELWSGHLQTAIPQAKAELERVFASIASDEAPGSAPASGATDCALAVCSPPRAAK